MGTPPPPPPPNWRASTYGPDANAPYPPVYAGAAAAGILVAPVVTIVVLSVMLSSEQVPARREQLRRWRLFSAIWLVFWLVLVVVVFVAFGMVTNQQFGVVTL